MSLNKFVMPLSQAVKQLTRNISNSSILSKSQESRILEYSANIRDSLFDANRAWADRMEIEAQNPSQGHTSYSTKSMEHIILVACYNNAPSLPSASEEIYTLTITGDLGLLSNIFS